MKIQCPYNSTCEAQRNNYTSVTRCNGKYWRFCLEYQVLAKEITSEQKSKLQLILLQKVVK